MRLISPVLFSFFERDSTSSPGTAPTFFLLAQVNYCRASASHARVFRSKQGRSGVIARAFRQAARASQLGGLQKSVALQYACMNSTHRETLVAIFAEPPPASLEWPAIKSLLVAISYEIVEGDGSRVRFRHGAGVVGEFLTKIGVAP